MPGTRVSRFSVSNVDIARFFLRYATLLEIDGANAFSVCAYRNAAQLIEGLARGVADMVRDGEDLTELEGIGADLAGKIEAIVRTGRLEQLDELERRMPAGLVELTTVPGLGPKRVKALYDTLDVRGIEVDTRSKRGAAAKGASDGSRPSARLSRSWTSSEPSRASRTRSLPAASGADGKRSATSISSCPPRAPWDPELGTAQFEIGYWDRIARRIVRVPLQRVRFGEASSFTFDAAEDDGSVHTVPLHRVRAVWRNVALIWKRPLPAVAP